MPNSTPSTFVHCPTCGLKYLAGETLICWMCGANMLGPPGEMASGSRPPNRVSPPLQFSLATLLWVVSLISLQLAFCVSVPGLAIVTFLLALPITARVHTAAIKRREAERPEAPLIEFMAAGSLPELYADFILVLFLTLIAAFFAFQVTRNPLEWNAFAIGGLAALATPILLYVFVARRKARRDMDDKSK